MWVHEGDNGAIGIGRSFLSRRWRLCIGIGRKENPQPFESIWKHEWVFYAPIAISGVIRLRVGRRAFDWHFGEL
jgi:hypothetical protein